MQSAQTLTLTPDDHLFFLSSALDTLENIVDFPDSILTALIGTDGFSYQHGRLAGLSFVLTNRVCALYPDQILIDEQELVTQRDYTILPADLGRTQSSDLGRSPAASLSVVGQGGNQ